MSNQPFHLVDVFAERRYAGNQLAVVEGAESLSTETMERIAREFDYSETAFLGPADPATGRYPVRIFTPEGEIPFAGHPTLGRAAVILETRAPEDPTSVSIDLPIGTVPVRVERADGHDRLWMTQHPPEFIQRFRHETLAGVLGLEVAELDQSRPVHAVTTGLPTVIVPLETRRSLERISIDRAAYDEFVAGHRARNVLAFCPEPRDESNDLAVRVFAPYYGVPEDPATGSSNGCLAAYLLEHGDPDRRAVSVRVEQGYVMGRPSLLHLRAERTGEETTVQVGGQVLRTAHGVLAEEFEG